MSRALCSAFIAAFVLAGGVSPLARQSAPAAPPAQENQALPRTFPAPPVITLVDGSGQLVRQGQAQAAAANMPLIAGDRLITGEGRVAVRFPDGSWLHLDNRTSVDFLSLSLVRLLDGRVIFGVAGRGGERPSLDYHVDAAAGSVQIQAAGEYHVATYADGSVPEVELAVVTGVATLLNERGNVEVQAGERTWAREGTSPEYAQAFNSARLGDFEQWSEAQEAREVGGASAQYLPTQLTAYASTFDEDGRWMSTPEYGYVWYPRVSAGWRPYYNGYWDYVGPYGWTWIGNDPWCWPTHHYGRWGVSAGVWFWIPGTYWAPAWVSWGFTSGYVGWCPLDYHNHPVYGIHGGVGGYYGRGPHDPWHAWTVVPRHGFGPRPVPNYALNGPRLAAVDRGQFHSAGRLPDPPRAVARAGAASGLRAGAVGGAAASPRTLASVPSSEFARSRASRDAFPLPSATASNARAFGGPSRYGVPGSANTNALAGRAVPRGYSAPGYSPGTAAPRSAPSYSPRASMPGIDRPSTPGAAMPRSAPRSYSTPDYSPRTSAPRGSDRPSAPGVVSPRAAPRTYSTPDYSPRSSQPAAPAYSPRSSQPSTPSYSPRYSVPRGQEYSPRSYSRPVPSAPAAPRSYSQPSYSAPRSYSAPSYSAPRGYSAPSYSAPRGSTAPPAAAPRSYGGMPSSPPRGYSAPPSAPRGPSGGMSAPSRGPAAGAPSRGAAPQAQPRGRGR
ncbi:MAG: DUF6600 domain-containing protein [Bacteroidales bacterium]